jgi:hypothetical protein
VVEVVNKEALVNLVVQGVEEGQIHKLLEAQETPPQLLQVKAITEEVEQQVMLPLVVGAVLSLQGEMELVVLIRAAMAGQVHHHLLAVLP